MKLSPERLYMHSFVLSVVPLLMATPLLAQDRSQQGRQVNGTATQINPATSQPARAGSTADAGVGQIGQRQERGQAAATIKPLGRLDTRIANRVQNRIRNRIDRNYDPLANATSPFRVAGDQVQRAGNTRPD